MDITKNIDATYMNNDRHKDDFLEFASKDYRRNEQLNAYHIDLGVVLPLKKSPPGGPLMGYGGVLDQYGEYVMASAQIGKGDTLPRFIGKYDYDRATEQYYDEVVIYIGAFPNHWGHFLVDMVYRFWYFKECMIPYRIVYCSENAEITGVYLEFLSLLGISKDRLLRISVPSRFKQVIVPEQGYMACEYYTNEYREVFKTITSNLPPVLSKSYDKIYMSRAHFSDAQKKEIGENSIEDNFERNGYKILYMEELSFSEQAFYINHAKKVAALSGTLCHNILFAGQDTELIILNKTHIINTHQVLIDQMMNIKVYYIDVYLEPFKKFPVSYGGGPFLLDSRKLSLFFQENHMVLKSENWVKRQTNKLIYIWLCTKVILYKQYAKTYYTLCKYPHIIGVFRELKLWTQRIKRLFH